MFRLKTWATSAGTSDLSPHSFGCGQIHWCSPPITKQYTNTQTWDTHRHTLSRSSSVTPRVKSSDTGVCSVWSVSLNRFPAPRRHLSFERLKKCLSRPVPVTLLTPHSPLRPRTWIRRVLWLTVVTEFYHRLGASGWKRGWWREDGVGGFTQFCFVFVFLEMRERSELLQLDFQRYSLFKQILKKKKKKEVTMWVNVFGWRGHVNDFLQTFNCCCSSLFSRANTVFVSLFLLIEAWMDFLSFPTDLKTQNMWNAKNQQHKKQWGFKIRAHQNTSFPTYE